MSDENGENEATEQYKEEDQEEDQEEVEEVPENTDQEGGRHCDLFGELNVPAGEEATAETEEGNETKEEVQEEDANAEQNDAEQTEKPAEEEATETKESTEEKDGEKPAEQAEGDQQQSSEDPSAQPGTKTNSDRQQDIFSRVFVGHLPTDRCTRNDVEKLFSQYGTITGCSVLNGYGFVQYKTPDSVDEAIRHLHGHHFFGANIVVDKTDAARAALGEKPQKRPTPRRSGGYNRSDYHQPPPRSHGYRDYGPPPYHPRGYGPPPHHYDHREGYYHAPPQRRGPPQHHYGYHRPRDDYYDGRPHYDYSEY